MGYAFKTLWFGLLPEGAGFSDFPQQGEKFTSVLQPFGEIVGVQTPAEILA